MAAQWTPSGRWIREFRAALDDVFTDADLELLTADYFHPQAFSKIAPPGGGQSFEGRLQTLIQWARMNDYLPDLVNAARERRPRSAAIAAIAGELGLAAGSGTRLDNPMGGALEEIIRERAAFLKPARVVERLAALEGQLCRLDVPGGGGTGFLVGPDIVLTNQHVIERVTNGLARRQDVRAVFDHRETSDGAPLSRAPIGVELADDWLIRDWPPSAYDSSPDLGEAEPEQVDVALLRLASPIGDEPVGGPSLDATAQPRGWVDATEVAPGVAAGNQVFLLQHPRGEAQRLSIGTVTGFNHSGTRMRYDANSKDGSSGSPCFNADFQLVSVHHARDAQAPPRWNQAVPLPVIQAALAEAHIVLEGAVP